MNNPDHIFESLETIFWVKILKFFDADLGSRMEKIRIQDKHPGFATLDFNLLVPVCHHYCIGIVDRVRVEKAKKITGMAPLSDLAPPPFF